MAVTDEGTVTDVSRGETKIVRENGRGQVSKTKRRLDSRKHLLSTDIRKRVLMVDVMDSYTTTQELTCGNELFNHFRDRFR